MAAHLNLVAVKALYKAKPSFLPPTKVWKKAKGIIHLNVVS